MPAECRFYVFREGRRTARAEWLLGGVRRALAIAQDENSWLDALLRCGELECALEDAGDPAAATLADFTDACAKKLVSWSYKPQPELIPKLPLRLGGELNVATPEGFAYYALHPRQYADVVRHIHNAHEAVVIGIRSIGSTLSAMTAAALRRAGSRVQRFTVRPTGHPFDRTTEFTTAQFRKIQLAHQRHALFIVVDEGPGLSGSSFLSVAEALCTAGVPAARIVLVPSHPPNLKALRAHNAAARWKKFRCVTLPEARYPQGSWIGGGQWRQRFLGPESAWPGAWTPMERAKFLSEDTLWKFEGLGPYGARARETARTLAEAGFSPRVTGDEAGYLGYEFISGRAATRGDLTPERLQRLAAYCAFRVEQFSCDVPHTQRKDLLTMLRVNHEREFGHHLPKAWLQLEVRKPALCDARLHPHEWLLATDGRFLKLDATAHGDGHFFPGPCDIAWDLAGAIVEWDMDPATRAAFLREYTAITHDNAAARVGFYLLAYCVFRCAWARMAAAGMHGTPEEPRLTRDAERYRTRIEILLKEVGAAVPAAHAS